jgi:putative aldouronate transport system permease protein
MAFLQKAFDRPITSKKEPGEKPSFWVLVKKDMRRNRYIYLMLLPVILYYLLFHYGPMYGAIIAFQDYIPNKGVFGSKWIGFENFENFFNSFFFLRLIRNTLAINLLDLIFGFPAPILLAVLLNEIRWEPFKRFVQTVSYMPHFISVVVIVGILIDFFARDGLVNNLISPFLAEPVAFMQSPELFRQLFVGSGIWQHMGWTSIIFLAAITNIDPSLYEAAMVDGAGRFRQLIHITLPGIMPTVLVLLILRLGSMMSIGYEKIILMYSPATYETADVISTYVYRRGILNTDYSFSAAVGLFNSVINFGLVVIANTISRKVNNTSLW